MLTIGPSFAQSDTDIDERKSKKGIFVNGAISFNSSFEKTKRIPSRFSPNEYSNTTSNNFGFYTNTGKKISDHWDIGLSFNLLVRSFEYKDSQTDFVFSKSETTQVDLGFFSRYNFSLFQNVGVFLQPGAFFSVSRDKDTNGSFTYEINTVAGCTYQISPRFRLLMNLGSISYNFVDSETIRNQFVGTNSSTRFRTAFSISSIHIGGELFF